jgi:hypothetical protein
MQVHAGTYVFCTVRGKWIKTGDLLKARYSAASALWGSQVVVSGGQDNVSVLSAVEAFDAERGWVELPGLPGARKYHGMATVRRCVHIGLLKF